MVLAKPVEILPTTTISPSTSCVASHMSVMAAESDDDSNKTAPIVATTAAAKSHHPMTLPPTKRDDRKLFVGGLPPDVTEDEFRSFFEQFGPVFEAVVMFDRVTGRSRGFGFVTFHDKAVRSKLLDEQNPKRRLLSMRDKTIEVKAAQPKSFAAGTTTTNPGFFGNYEPINNDPTTSIMMNYCSPEYNLSQQQQQQQFYYFPPTPTLATTPLSPVYYAPESNMMPVLYEYPFPHMSPAMFYPPLSQ